jgi:plasmid maintenance system antidote protein VapI
VTRRELQALITRIREAHPEVAIRLHRQLTPSGEFRVDLAVRLELQIDIAPNATDTARALPEEVEVMIEQASAETREIVRRNQIGRDPAAGSTAVTPQERVRAADPVIVDLESMIVRQAATTPRKRLPRPRSLWALLDRT